jgi:hypothetical protein
VALFALSQRLHINYWALYAWVGLFVGAYCVTVAALDLCALIRHATRFTCDVFGAFVCTIYIHDGITAAVHRAQGGPGTAGVFVAALFAVTVAAAFALGAVGGLRAGVSLLPAPLRRVVADYALPIAVALAVGISYSVSGVDVERLPIPDGMRPTWTSPGPGAGSQEAAWQRRPEAWFVGLPALPAAHVALAAAIALPITFLVGMGWGAPFLCTHTGALVLAMGAVAPLPAPALGRAGAPDVCVRAYACACVYV